MIQLDNYTKKRGKKQAFDLLAICQSGQQYFVPDVVFLLNSQGCSIEHAVSELQAQLKANLGRISTERTSEIFITGQTRGGRVEKRRLSFFPQLHGSWISHFTIRKQAAPASPL